jgi:hypothetical protein
VAILGPRQCGKSTLALSLLKGYANSIYLDLEKMQDLKKLDDPELFFSQNKNSLVCLDEIQRRPDLFPALRSLLDERNKNGTANHIGIRIQRSLTTVIRVFGWQDKIYGAYSLYRN